MRRYWLQLPGIAGSVLVADQASKALVAGSMAPGQSFAPVPALEQVFRITYSQNRGAAFGLLPAAADVFSGGGAGVCGGAAVAVSAPGGQPDG